jgi:phosphoglycolate phosphatase
VSASLASLRAVLVDLDGTLMDTAPDIALAANRMREDFGMAPLPVPRVASFVGKGVEVLVHRALVDALDGAVDEATFARGRESFSRHYHAVNGDAAVLFDGARSALAELRAAGLRLACVTNKAREFTVPLLARMQVADSFDVVVAGDDVREKKPHPALLLAACEQLGVAPAQAAMIGDSVNDAVAASAAGMPIVLVETGYNEGESVHSLAEAPGVGAILPRLVDAASWILHHAKADRTDAPPR